MKKRVIIKEKECNQSQYCSRVISWERDLQFTANRCHVNYYLISFIYYLMKIREKNFVFSEKH